MPRGETSTGTRVRALLLAAAACLGPAILTAGPGGEAVSESGLKFSLVPPNKGAGSASGKPPLILFLHGTGGQTACYSAYVSEARIRGYYSAVPVSTGDGKGDPKAGNTGDDRMQRWAGVDVPKLVDLAREVQRKHGADPRRTYIAGYSNGAFYAFETALRHPEVFAALLSTGGGCNVRDFAEGAQEVGCYLVHGTADNSVSFSVGKDAENSLKAAGFKDVVFREKTGQGHIVFSDEVKPFFEWLAKQKRRTAPGSNRTLAWEETDAPAALQKAAADHKRLLLYLHGKEDDDFLDWLEREALADPEVTALAPAFVCVKASLDDPMLPKDLKVKRTSVLVVDASDPQKPKILTRFDKPLETKALATKLKSMRK